MNKTHVIIPKFNSENEYMAFLAMADDAENLNQSLAEYNNLADEVMSGIIRDNSNGECVIHRERIVLSDMMRWLSDKGLMNIGKNRTDYYAYLANMLYR